MPWGAIDLLARAELRARWRGLVALGVLAGLAAAAVLGTVAVARRTSTAPARLLAATRPGDARVIVYGEPGVADELAGLPEVARSWTAAYGVARIEGSPVRYVGLLAGPERPPELLRPVLLRGRAPDPTDPEAVLVTERVADELHVGPGSTIPVKLLTRDEVAAFDTGFGEPDGPALRFRVAGVMRLPESTADNAPILGTPALYARHGRDVAAGLGVFIDLADRPGARADLATAVARINAEHPQPAGASEFPTADLSDPLQGTATASAAARVPVTGLAVAAAIAALAGLLALGQAAARHHASGVTSQEVESALGLTAMERVAARVAPAVLAAAVAGVLAAAGVVVAGAVDPVGALHRIEPRPGWAPNVALAVLGGAVAAAVVLLTAALTARRAPAGRRARLRPTPAARLAGRLGSAPAAVGLGFAVDPGRGRRRVPVRSSLAGAVLGVAGVVAALTFGSSVHRLVASPERYGWAADLSVADVTDAITADLVADPRLADVAVVDQAPVRLGARTLSGQVVEPAKGEVGWTILDGRVPARAGEVVLGTRAASRDGLEVGDEVDGLRVVGIGIGPSVNNEHLGDLVLLDRADFERRKRTEPFANALVRVADGIDVDRVTADLGRTLEVDARFRPTEVQNLGELGHLPAALGAFLALLAGAALAHALVLTTRRRAGDLAVLRTLGFTPRQAGSSIVTMALATAAVGIAAGAPLGVLVGRLVWWGVARSTGAGTDPSIPYLGIAAVAAALAAGAVVVALLPARRAARLRPALLLRTE
jgi:hypothetical protein